MSSFHSEPSPQRTPTPVATIEVGSTIDRYQLDTLLGAGGMGQVYRAVHQVTQRRCALKLLPDQLSRDATFVSRFYGEAQMLARLNHPNIVQIYSGGESSHRFFLEMEYVDGGDLLKRVKDHLASTGQGLPEDEVRRTTDAILAALDYAHREGVIHRDLKPANILLSTQGDVKVSDFGLATVVGEELHQSRIERSVSLAKITSMETVSIAASGDSSSFAGTILYMSPQALRGDPPDPRDDLFSLGVVVYYMLVGRTPAVNYTPPSRSRPGLSREWDRFIATCLSEERSERFPDANAARAALRRTERRRPKLVLPVAAAVILVAAASLAYVSADRQPTGDPASASTPTPAPLEHGELLAQEIAFDPIANRRLGTPPFALTPRASSGLPVTLSIVSGSARIAGSTVIVTGAGDVVVRAEQLGNTYFAAAAPVERSFTVVDPDNLGLKEQQIVFEPLPDRTFGDPPFELFASTSSGLPVSFTVVSGPATIAGQTLQLTGVGSVTIRCEQPGDPSFLAAPSLERTFLSKDPVPPSLTVMLADNVPLMFVRIPAGHAILGSPDAEIGRRSDEQQREYRRNESFLMAATETTQRQYQAVMNTRPGYHRVNWSDRPVEQIRFADLVESRGGTGRTFIARLNALLAAQGLGEWEAVLPTEDDWEYACRAGTDTSYNNQTDLAHPVRDANAALVAVYGRTETAPVGSLAPNGWGLYDMHGNVAEWTRTGVLRGGSFLDEAAACRAAARVRGQSENPTPDRRFGFRLMLQRVSKTP